MVVDEGVIVEIVRPGTGDPVPEGDVGEVVVTSFNRAYPLIRFGTGDMSAVLRGRARAAAPTCASRAGWAAPTSAPRCAACSSIPSRSPRSRKKHPGLGRLRLVIDWVDQADIMTLRVEAAAPSADLEKAMTDTIRTVCKVGGKVELQRPAACPTTAR